MTRATLLAYLLEHLIDICQNSAMQVPVPVAFEAVCKGASRHFEDSIFHGLKFTLNSGVLTADR